MAADLKAQDRLILALDFEDVSEALGLLERLGELISFVKIPWALLLSPGGGMDIVKRVIREYGKKVFLDVKLNDIPNSIGLPLEIIGRAGVSFVTIHGNGRDFEAIIKERTFKDLKVFAVTLLTHMDAASMTEDFGVSITTEEIVVNRVKQLVGMGCDGVITSPLEITAIKKVVPENTIIVSPGIRLPSDSPNEHIRFADPATAIRSGADYIVVGRPIIHADDPVRAAQRYIDAIEEGLSGNKDLENSNPNQLEAFKSLLTAAVPEKKQSART